MAFRDCRGVAPEDHGTYSLWICRPIAFRMRTCGPAERQNDYWTNRDAGDLRLLGIPKQGFPASKAQVQRMCAQRAESQYPEPTKA